MRQSENAAKHQLPVDVRNVFTQAVASFPGDFAKQAQQIVRAHKPVGLPERFQPTMNLSDWDRIQREKQMQRQEAEAQVRAEQQRAEQQQLAQNNAWDQLVKQLKRDEVTEGQKSVQNLEQIMRSTPLPQIVENIRQQWQAYSPNVPVTLTTVREPHVEIRGNLNGEREITDRSRVGLKLSYFYQDVVNHAPESFGDPHSELGDYTFIPGGTYVDPKLLKELVIGVGMLTNYDFLSAEIASSTKYNGKGECYFVKSSGPKMVPGVISELRPGDNPVGIPVKYPGALQKLYELIADRVNDLAPSKVIPEANSRIQEFRRDHPEPKKKGFWS